MNSEQSGPEGPPECRVKGCTCEGGGGVSSRLPTPYMVASSIASLAGIDNPSARALARPSDDQWRRPLVLAQVAYGHGEILPNCIDTYRGVQGKRFHVAQGVEGFYSTYRDLHRTLNESNTA